MFVAQGDPQVIVLVQENLLNPGFPDATRLVPGKRAESIRARMGLGGTRSPRCWSTREMGGHGASSWLCQQQGEVFTRFHVSPSCTPSAAECWEGAKSRRLEKPLLHQPGPSHCQAAGWKGFSQPMTCDGWRDAEAQNSRLSFQLLLEGWTRGGSGGHGDSGAALTCRRRSRWAGGRSSSPGRSARAAPGKQGRSHGPG